MKSATAIVTNPLGLHARPAAMLAARAATYAASIRIENGAKKADAKSIMALMLLAAPQGSLLAIEIEGFDEDEAMAEITAMFEDAFGEAEKP